MAPGGSRREPSGLGGQGECFSKKRRGNLCEKKTERYSENQTEAHQIYTCFFFVKAFLLYFSSPGSAFFFGVFFKVHLPHCPKPLPVGRCSPHPSGQEVPEPGVGGLARRENEPGEAPLVESFFL